MIKNKIKTPILVMKSHRSNSVKFFLIINNERINFLSYRYKDNIMFEASILNLGYILTKLTNFYISHEYFFPYSFISYSDRINGKKNFQIKYITYKDYFNFGEGNEINSFVRLKDIDISKTKNKDILDIISQYIYEQTNIYFDFEVITKISKEDKKIELINVNDKYFFKSILKNNEITIEDFIQKNQKNQYYYEDEITENAKKILEVYDLKNIDFKSSFLEKINHSNKIIKEHINYNLNKIKELNLDENIIKYNKDINILNNFFNENNLKIFNLKKIEISIDFRYDSEKYKETIVQKIFEYNDNIYYINELKIMLKLMENNKLLEICDDIIEIEKYINNKLNEEISFENMSNILFTENNKKILIGDLERVLRTEIIKEIEPEKEEIVLDKELTKI